MLKRVSLILLGITIALIVTEASLRIAGYLYYNFWMKEERKMITREQSELARIENQKIPAEDKTLVKILCLGDSWTFGLGADAGYSYPAQLQKIFDKEEPNKYKIYNAGIPGCTSTKLLEYMPRLMKMYEPEIAVIMVGLNDAHNPDVEGIIHFHNWRQGYYGKLKRFLKDLRLYKIIQFIIDGMKEKLKTSIAGDIPDTHKTVNPESDKYALIGENFYREGRFTTAKDYFIKAIENDRDNEMAYIQLAHMFEILRDYDKCLETLKALIDLKPHPERKEMLYKHLFLIYQDNPFLHDRIVSLVREIGSDSQFKNPGMPFILDRIAVDKNLTSNLREILQLIRSKNRVMIIQIYPTGDNEDTARTFSAENDIPLVDNRSVFANLFNIDNYFDNSGRHPNRKGYNIIASNVYKTIKGATIEQSHNLNISKNAREHYFIIE